MSDSDDPQNSDPQNVVRIGRGSSKHLTYHGPVEIRTRDDINVVTFTGSEESDVLHAAAGWMTEHPYALVIGINWYGDHLTPHDVDPGNPPLHRLDLTVDLRAERELYPDNEAPSGAARTQADRNVATGHPCLTDIPRRGN